MTVNSKRQILLQLPIVLLLSIIIISCSSTTTPVTPITGLHVNSLSSQTAYITQAVIINGQGFQSSRGTSFVTLNGVQIADSNYYRWDSTSIVFFVPNNAATGDVVVNVNGTASNATTLTIVAAHSNAPSAPYIDYLPQDIAQVRQQIGIKGGNFSDNRGQGWVEFNGVRADNITFWTNNSITVMVPDNATSGKVVVFANINNTFVATNSASFTVQAIKPVVDCVEIEPGTFIMGDDNDSTYFDVTQPAHNVQITYKFLMATYEITQKQYKKVENGSNPSQFQNDNNPVEQVSWFQAARFCNDLSKMERYDTCYTFSGSDPNDYVVTCNFNASGYRLPTEAEWEYACRAGTTSKYGGDGTIYDMGWTSQNANNMVHQVGGKMANAWGLYDMHGNVWEWCNDWFDIESYKNRPNPDVDPVGLSSTDTKEKTLRGGSYSDEPKLATSAYRSSNVQTWTNFNIGFRIVRKLK